MFRNKTAQVSLNLGRRLERDGGSIAGKVDFKFSIELESKRLFQRTGKGRDGRKIVTFSRVPAFAGNRRGVRNRDSDVKER